MGFGFGVKNGGSQTKIPGRIPLEMKIRPSLKSDLLVSGQVLIAFLVVPATRTPLKQLPFRFHLSHATGVCFVPSLSPAYLQVEKLTERSHWCMSHAGDGSHLPPLIPFALLARRLSGRPKVTALQRLMLKHAKQSM